MLTEFDIECPGLSEGSTSHNIHVYQWGDPDCEKVIICVHGLTRNGRDFDMLAEALEGDYHIIAPDMAGRGKSDWLDDAADYNYIAYVADMLHIMEQLKISSCDWIGTSMGGLMGMMIAANIPGLINKLVINDIGPLVPKEGLQRIGEYVGNAPKFKDKEEASVYFHKIFSPWGISEKEIEHMVEYGIQPEGEEYVVAYDPKIGDAFKDENGQPKKMEDISLWDIWQDVKCQVLVVRGENSDVLPKEVAKKMCAKPNVEMTEFQAIGHAPSLMEERQIKVVSEWIKD